MSNWQMEVIRMMLYVAFPVGMFHYFNQSDNVEESLFQQREKYLPPGSKKDHEEFKVLLENFNSDKQMKKIKEMEQQYNTYATA